MKATKNKVPEQNGSENKSAVHDNSLSTSRENKSINSSVEHVNKKQRILEKITYDDLEDDSNHKSVSLLNLSKVKTPKNALEHLLIPNISGRKVSAWSNTRVKY